MLKTVAVLDVLRYPNQVMKILLLLIALVAAFQAQDDHFHFPRPREIPFKEYQDYEKKYNKTYACPELEELRFNIYKSSVHEIERHNKGNYNWTMGINWFTDMLMYEFMPDTYPPLIPPVEIQFEEFKKNYTRTYGCPEEEEIRFQIFKHTAEDIDDFNKKNYTWKVAINNFTDWAGDEFRVLH